MAAFREGDVRSEAKELFDYVAVCAGHIHRALAFKVCARDEVIDPLVIKHRGTHADKRLV